jgi:hypothetical protein
VPAIGFITGVPSIEDTNDGPLVRGTFAVCGMPAAITASCA